MPSGTEQKALEAIEAIEKLGGKATISAVASKLRIEVSYARLLCNSLGRADYIDVLATEVCRITPQGKSYLSKEKKEEKMPSVSEQKALEAIEKLGGEATLSAIASKVGIEIIYVRQICNSLGKADYIDILATEVCKITPKGKGHLGKGLEGE